MAQKKAGDEIEVAFGPKQALILMVVAAAVLGGVYVWGFEKGHQKARRGEPSILSALARTSDPARPASAPPVPTQPAASSAAAAPPADSAPPPASSTVPRRPKPSPAGQAPGPPPAAPPRDRPPPAPSAPAAAAAPKPRPAPQPRRPPAARSQPARAPVTHYQVAALRDPGNAKKLVDTLRSMGLQARILPADQGLYRVQVGPFRDQAAADAARRRLTEQGFKPLPRRQ